MPVLALVLAACGTWDPTADTEPEADRTTPIEDADAGGQAELTVGDDRFTFSITDCFADPGEGIRFAGRSPDGDSIAGEWDPEAPEDATVYVTDSEGNAVYSSDATSSDTPSFEATGDGGFRVSGEFVSDTDEAVQGNLSGAC